MNHDTHLQSSKSIDTNSYKFDENGNILVGVPEDLLNDKCVDINDEVNQNIFNFEIDKSVNKSMNSLVSLNSEDINTNAYNNKDSTNYLQNHSYEKKNKKFFEKKEKIVNAQNKTFDFSRNSKRMQYFFNEEIIINDNKTEIKAFKKINNINNNDVNNKDNKEKSNIDNNKNSKNESKIKRKKYQKRKKKRKKKKKYQKKKFQKKKYQKKKK